MSSAGLETVFLANPEPLLRFLSAHSVGDEAEDLLHDLWLKAAAAQGGPIGAPLSNGRFWVSS